MTETRFDVVPIRAVRADDGYIHDSPVLTRVGVFNYRDPSKPNGIRREFRPPEEVFHADSLKSYRGKPITNGHQGILTSKNARQHSYGTLLSEGRQDGENADHAVGDIIIHDPSPVDAGNRELSLGYKLRLDETPGEWNGQPYDAVQRDIRIDHLALVPQGRAGVARLNLDAADTELPQITPQPSKDKDTMPDQTLVDVRADESSGLVYKAAPEIAHAMTVLRKQLDTVKADSAASLAGATTRADEAIAAAKVRADEAIARADEAIRARDKAQGEADALKSQMDKVRADAAAEGRTAAIVRLNLEAQAKEVGYTFNADATDSAIRIGMLGKMTPDIRLDGKSDEYINAAFDIAMSDQAKRKTNAGAQRATGVVVQMNQDAAIAENSAAAARRRMLKGA